MILVWSGAIQKIFPNLRSESENHRSICNKSKDFRSMLFIYMFTDSSDRKKKEGRERKSDDNVSDSKYHGEPEVFRKAEELGVGQHIEGVRKVIKMWSPADLCAGPR